MRVLVFGAGAIGSLLGGFLARMGHEVALIGRAWHLDAVEREGLRITGIWGEYRIRTFECFHSVGEIPAAKRKFDLILFTVKSYDSREAAAEAAPLVGECTTLLSFQNGLTNIAEILEKVPPERFLAGRIITGAEIAPGAVRVTVTADDLLVGEPGGSESRRGALSAREAAGLFSLARLPARPVPDIVSHLWQKGVYNCALNGPCSILGIPYGGMLETSERRDSLRQVVEECYAVARAKAIRLLPESADAYFELLVATLIPRTAGHFPSMRYDLERRGRTEIESMNGAIWRFGENSGVPTPENRRITERIRERTTHRQEAR